MHTAAHTSPGINHEIPAALLQIYRHFVRGGGVSLEKIRKLPQAETYYRVGGDTGTVSKTHGIINHFFSCYT